MSQVQPEKEKKFNITLLIYFEYFSCINTNTNRNAIFKSITYHQNPSDHLVEFLPTFKVKMFCRIFWVWQYLPVISSHQHISLEGMPRVPTYFIFLGMKYKRHFLYKADLNLNFIYTTFIRILKAQLKVSKYWVLVIHEVIKNHLAGRSYLINFVHYVDLGVKDRS